MRIIRLAFPLIFSGVFAYVSAQPVACPVLVSEALAAVGDACGGIGRNQACYGSFELSATPRDPDAVLAFSAPGDLVGVADIGTLRLSSFAPDVPEWGIALMALQANLPDNLPGQNAMFVLFGDTLIENEGGDSAPLPDVFVHAGGGVNVRQTPSTAAQIVGRVGPVDQRAVGRLADGTWLRVALDDGTDGWVSAGVVAVTGDPALLPESLPSDPAPSVGGYGPMQAFRLKTGIGVPSCADVPADGVMIQTPQGMSSVEIRVNGVSVTLGSTAVVRAVPGDTMRFTLIEGRSTLRLAGAVTMLTPWQTAVVALDTSGNATGQITVGDAAASDFAGLPVSLLPELVALPIIDADHPYASGFWQVHNDVEPDGVSCTAADGSRTPLGFIDGEGVDVLHFDSPDTVLFGDLLLTRVTEGEYTQESATPLDYFGYTLNTRTTALHMASPLRFSADRSVIFSAPNGQTCAFTVAISGFFLSAGDTPPAAH